MGKLISGINKPTNANDDTELKNQLANKADKSELFSKNYNDLTNKPEIPTVPTDVSSFNNDAGYISSIPAEYITESELNAKGFLTEHQDISGKADKSDLASVATSGSYNDLTNKPDIPSKTSDLTNDSGFITSIPSEYITNNELQQMSEGFNAELNKKSDILNYNDHTLNETETYNNLEKANSIEEAAVYTINKPINLTKGTVCSIEVKFSDNTNLLLQGEVVSDLLYGKQLNYIQVQFTDSGTMNVMQIFDKAKYSINVNDGSDLIEHDDNTSVLVVYHSKANNVISLTITKPTVFEIDNSFFINYQFVNDAEKENWNNKADRSELFSGSYNDLTNKPLIPSIQGLASESFVNQQISKIQHPTYDDTTIKNQLANKADKSELFSGNYNDLSNKPTIPSIEGLASESFVKNEIAKAQLEIEGEIPTINLDGLATKDELNQKADKTEVPSIEGLASESYVQQEIAKIQCTGGGGDVVVGDDGVSEDEKAYVDDMMYSALGGLKFIKITQERYDALATKDPNTIYIVVSPENMNNSTGEEGVTDMYNLRWTEGSNLNDTGSVVTNDSQASYRLSDFIKVNSEINYRINTSISSQFQVFYYDKNKNYIGKSTIRNDKTAFAIYGYEGFIEFPENVKYFRIRTNNKTSSVEINELGKRDDTFTAFQFREGYTVASNGSVSAASDYMVSGDIKLEPDYDYEIKIDGNKTRVVFFNTDGNKTGSCLPTDSTYYEGPITLTRADIPEAAVSFRMRFSTGGAVNMNNIHEYLQVIKTPRVSKYITPITSWMQSTGFDENGAEIDDIAAMNTGYVAITSGYDYMYTLKRGVPFGFQIFYYNSNKAFISCSEVQDDPIGNKRFDIPNGAAYYRIKVSQKNSLTIDNVNENVEIKAMPAVDGMLYQFGVLSDCHVDAGSDGNFYHHNHATNDYRKAVKFMEDEGAEFVAYGGDMATGDPGVSEADYRKVIEILKNAHIPHYMISGNHDYGYFFKALIESRKYYIVEKGNDIFIFVNTQDRGVTGGVDREIIDGVRAVIDANPNKRLFLFYHYFIRNHGSGDGATDVKYYTGDTIGDDYEKYPLSLEWANLIINTPNLIFCHGHSHFRFKCQEVYAQNNYSHTDGECHSVHIPSCAVPRTMSADSTSVSNWPEGSEGYMVKVFADRVEFHAVQLTAYRYLTTYNFTINLPQGN